MARTEKKCKNCVWWNKISGRCCNGNLESLEPEDKTLCFVVDSKSDEEYLTQVITGPEFGCVHFRKQT